MNDLFQIPTDDEAVDPGNPFRRFGLDKNPFPEVGLDLGVFYSRHIKAEIQRVNEWIRDVVQATDPEAAGAGPVRPLAVFGSLGVGKTHLLRFLERGLSADPATPVLRKGLADEGMTRLALANLFLRYLPLSDGDEEPGSGLIRALTERARADEDRRKEMFGVLRDGSPVRVPFRALLRPEVEPDAAVWMSRWLRREYTTPAQRAKLGVAGVLRSEGEAVRAVADLMRLARAAGLLRVWFVMIDQLEELWRPGVITSSRRARFLTDLRHLVDHALEGAPIAVLLAWNTTVDERLFRGTFRAAVAAQMQQDYRALWQRLGDPVNLPPLSDEEVWPFAAKYLEAAGVGPEAGEARRRLWTALQEAEGRVLDALREQGAETHAPRRVLRVWRQQALEIARTAS